MNIASKPTLICTAIEENKKKWPADQETLKRAAKKLGPYFARFGDQGEQDENEEGSSTRADAGKDNDDEKKGKKKQRKQRRDRRR